MNRQELELAQSHSVNNRKELDRSRTCGCYHCKSVFPPGSVLRWIDRSRAEAEWTALCPECGIDSVIGDAAGFGVGPIFLQAMNKRWFSDSR